ncbi:TPA: hypothetical protein N0H29_000594 [Pseudomonas aeruginosa]|uniref:hypothetical protein n=1 Tax=Pseudomonas aeruginosa TaxID=287 RepID=UPI000AA7EED9|nr:hypothetical protein [Pseudomonas aeruginosa]EKY0763449.1 hypothetical protein [Pseudomonas aeruginosa]EKZ3176186.1 hypothetical protein [Pseudomonas aeruginosa]MBG4760504.1 hypothetical protein [Pseudomonas aeruginosa]MBV6002870.1 hypothetical protein [Pseudomonas aeruginosa]MBV6328352.1 hypothetical protein [Pseudomonas aeruginosa]
MSLEIKSPEDFFDRPDYREVLDFGEKTGRELLEILGAYIFPDTKSVKCGIRNCRTPHRRGYLISTTDGLETNIGNVCGKKHLGAIFTEKTSQYRKKQAYQRNLEQFHIVKSRVQELWGELDELKLAAERVSKLKIILNKCHPNVVRALINRSKVNDAVLGASIPMTREEAERLYVHEAKESVDGKVQTFEAWLAKGWPKKKVVAGQIAGLKFWTNDLHKALRQEILSPAEELRNMDVNSVDQLSLRRLAEFSRWSQQLDANMERARIIISDGEAFFELQNIKMLRLLGDELDEASSLLLEPALHGFRTQAAWFYGVGG